MTIQVRRIRTADAAVARRLRLAALADAPTAFEATYAEERAYPDAVWRERAASNEAGVRTVGYLAVAAGAPVGLVVGVREEDDTAVVKVVSLWVAPDHRRSGAGRALVEAVCAWAAERGCREVALEVTDVNPAARGLYRACGFVETGEQRPWRHDPAVTEIRMVRPVARG